MGTDTARDVYFFNYDLASGTWTDEKRVRIVPPSNLLIGVVVVAAIAVPLVLGLVGVLAREKE